MIFSHGLRGVFTQRRGVSLETGKQDPLEPERNLDTQRGVCSLGHLSSRSQTRRSKNEVTKTQGGLEVCSITAAKRKPSLLHTRHPQSLCLPRSQPLRLLKPVMKPMTDSINRGCYRGTSHVSGAWLGFLCTGLFRTFRFVLPLPSALQKPKLKEAK